MADNHFVYNHQVLSSKQATVLVEMTDYLTSKCKRKPKVPNYFVNVRQRLCCLNQTTKRWANDYKLIQRTKNK